VAPGKLTATFRDSEGVTVKVRARLRAGVTVGIAALVTVAIAACAPIATMKPYDPSDGVSTTVGDVKVLNALVITKAGAAGNLLFSAYNPSNELVQLNVQYDANGVKQTKTAALLPDVTSNFGYGATGQFLLPGLDTQAGSLIKIYFQYGNQEGKQIDVPVLDGGLAPYSTLLPTPTPTPTTMPVLPPPVTPAPTATGN
jgi:hypothetical protein